MAGAGLGAGIDNRDERLRQGSAAEESPSRIITSPLEINRRNFLRSSLGALAVPALNRVNAGVIPVGANPRLFEQEGARYAGFYQYRYLTR